ncbi:MAG: 1-acyl-sn-glycerol-3-phosphate acyltransferase [Bacteroidota bacterium]
MLYRFAWVLMWVTFRIYFRRIDVLGVEKIEPSKPSILIANHPASFLDAMVLAVFLKRDVHFYVRSDIFRHPLVLKILTGLHMIPIYSREHGMQHVGKNHMTFQRGKELLMRGDLLLIFPEGFSRRSKKMEPIKKGAARVALQTAFEDVGIPHLSIQSIALHYSFHGVRSDLLIHIGEKMDLDRYRASFADLPSKAINELTSDMAVLFERNILHVNEEYKTQTAEEVLVFLYNECLQHKYNFFFQARALCAKLDAQDKVEFDLYTRQVTRYKELLALQKINDRSLSSNPIHPVQLISNLFLTVELYLIGKLFWFIPGKLVKWMADKTVTRIDFYTSVTTGILAFVSLIWWVSLSAIAIFNGWDLLSVIFISAPLIAYITMQWEYNFIDLKAYYNLKRLKKHCPEVSREIAELRCMLLY